MESDPVKKLTLAAFEKLVNGRFILQTDASPGLELILAKVDSHTSVPPAKEQQARVESFSVIFKGPHDPLLPQRTYTLEHPELGTFMLFLVPVGRDADGVQYEAIFNRFIR